MEGFDSRTPLRGGTEKLHLFHSIKCGHDLYVPYCMGEIFPN